MLLGVKVLTASVASNAEKEQVVPACGDALAIPQLKSSTDGRPPGNRLFSDCDTKESNRMAYFPPPLAEVDTRKQSTVCTVIQVAEVREHEPDAELAAIVAAVPAYDRVSVPDSEDVAVTVSTTVNASCPVVIGLSPRGQTAADRRHTAASPVHKIYICLHAYQRNNRLQPTQGHTRSRR